MLQDRILSSAENNNPSCSSAFVTTRWNLILSGGDSEKTDEHQIRRFGGALSDILAADFFLCSAAWLLTRGRGGPNSGFFSQDTGRRLASEGGSHAGPFSFLTAQVRSKFFE